MPGVGPDAAGLATFERDRPRLLRLAHRMLGSISDAEDVVQTAWLRWSAADRAAVLEPRAWLTRTVARLALDALRSARRRREAYIGPWLPEPVIAGDEGGLDEDVLSTALMLALERLSPLERAAFLLHDVFGVAFSEVARTLGRDAAACRQLASRARRRVREPGPRPTVPHEKGEALARAFFEATRDGDASALSRMLAADVVAYMDGGGQRPAALNPIVGRDRVVRFFSGLAGKRKGWPRRLVRCLPIDGSPGMVTLEGDGLPQTTALQAGAEGIVAIYIVRNPSKLRHLAIAREPHEQNSEPHVDDDRATTVQ